MFLLKIRGDPARKR